MNSCFGHQIVVAVVLDVKKFVVVVVAVVDCVVVADLDMKRVDRMDL